MGIVQTEAWVLYEGPETNGRTEPAELRREVFSFPDITDDELLVEPIYGCWEANMTHAVERKPVDVCRLRNEKRVVIGNAGVVRILKAGSSITSLREGDLCMVFCNGIPDSMGYPERILGYDAPNTIGVLAKRTKLKPEQLIKIPVESRHDPQQWAAFSLRYITAWANWKRAFACWKLQFDDEQPHAPFVCAWGGGVSLAEIMLAQIFGAEAAFISSNPERLKLMKESSIIPIDKRLFKDLSYDEQRYDTDPEFRARYLKSEKIFLELISELTRGRGVSIFVDYIGTPVFRATLKALGSRGVITSAGWKKGMRTSSIRALECMNWHIHVHTHYARYSQGVEAVQFAEENGWLPKLNGRTYKWDEVPDLARDYASGATSSYFPIYEIGQA